MSSTGELRDTFDRVVVINLAKRSERLARFTRIFEAWPFKPPQRFEAVDGLQLKLPPCKNRGPGAWGCMLSHQTVLASAIADKVSSLFVLEDDARPVPDFAARATEFLAKAPSDWDCLMFGGEHLMPPLAVSPGIVRCAGANRTHAYALRGNIMPILLAFWKHYKAEHCDIVLACLMRYFKVYAPNPFLIGQDAGHSDISDCEERLRFLSPGQIQAIANRAVNFNVDFPSDLSPGGGNRTHTGISAQRILSPSQENCKPLDPQVVTNSVPETLSPGLSLNPENDPDLAMVLNAWPTLPAEIRQTILGIIKTPRA